MSVSSTTLLGSSSGRNAGDAAIMSGLMEAVDEACGRKLTHEIPTIKPSYINANYEGCTTKPVSMMPWALSVKMLGVPTLRSMMRTDISLLFDAILFDRSLYNPLFNFMSTLYLMLPLVKKRGGKMAMYNVGAGPVVTPMGQMILRELCEIMDFITVRDQASYNILKEIGVQNPRILVGGDAAINCRPSDEETANRMLEAVGLTPGEEIFAINVNQYLDTWAGPDVTPMGKENFLNLYAGALNRLSKKIEVPFLFVTTQHHDVEITKALMSRLDPKHKVKLITNVDYNHYDVKAALSKVSILFSMRLHAMILASGALTPVFGILYQPKVGHYIEALGMDAKYGLSFKGITEDILYEHMLMGWEDRLALRAQVEKQVPVIQQKARKAARLVAALDQGEDIDAAFTRIAAE